MTPEAYKNARTLHVYAHLFFILYTLGPRETNKSRGLEMPIACRLAGYHSNEPTGLRRNFSYCRY